MAEMLKNNIIRFAYRKLQEILNAYWHSSITEEEALELSKELIENVVEMLSTLKSCKENQK